MTNCHQLCHEVRSVSCVKSVVAAGLLNLDPEVGSCTFMGCFLAELREILDASFTMVSDSKIKFKNAPSGIWSNSGSSFWNLAQQR
jgi:hypothetical protein